ncbi:MAG: amino acid adenylation domain-containing protein, partial [Gammaproteobacteria bacterium]
QRQWLQGAVLQEHLQYWKQALLGAPPHLQLPMDRPRPPMESFKGAMLSFELPASLLRVLKELGRSEEATLFMVSLAAYQVLLSRWSGQQEVVVGSPIAGRRNREVEGLIGFFVNTLALRTEVSGDLTFRQLLARVKELTLSAYAHQDLPFEALVAELRPERNLTRQPIFQVLLVLENFPQAQLELPAITWTWIDPGRETAHFDLTLYLHEVGDRLEGSFEYATDLFDVETIRRMSTHLRILLEAIAVNPDCPVLQLPLLDDMERRQLAQWNSTAAPYPHELCVHELFAEQAALTPGATAVVFGPHSISYAGLDRKANRLARVLRSLGVGADRLVAVCIERSVEMVVGLLGVLKAGGAYLPLDPSYPPERLQQMLDDAAPQIVLTQDKLKGLLPVTPATVISLDPVLKDLAGDADEPLASANVGATAESLVYLIYTSGSTGRPKGTGMPHRAMTNLIQWHRQNLPLRSEQRVLQFAALSFDVAFQEIFTTLCTGGTLVLLDEWVRRDARALAGLLRDSAISRLFVPPLVLQNLAELFFASGDAVPPSMQDVITAGEQLRISAEIVSLFERLAGCRLHNHYGPTETHVVTALTLAGNPGAWPALPSIGRPIANSQIHILDGNRQIVPIGLSGEIFVGGAGVARGYFRRPEQTAQRFIDDSFSDISGAKLYRTGDVGRWRADGTIEYLGRNDDQVKIRGYRIELGEIEVQLARHEHVKEAAVVAREDIPGEKRLVAYVTQRDEIRPSADALRAHLKTALPEYMVPSAIVFLERLPLSPNGKLDRRALPTPEPGAFSLRQYEAPHGEVEEGIARIWQELLRLDRIGRQDNFFELGGHSLHAMKLIAKIEQRFAARLSAIAVFQHPTVRQMAEAVQRLRSVGGELRDREDKGTEQGLHHAPLAFSQRAHWHWYQLGLRPAIRQIACATRLFGPLKIEVLQASISEVVRRHDALRTRITAIGGTLVQEVLRPEKWALEVGDLTALPASGRDSELRRLIDEQILQPIDLSSGPLFEARLFKLGDDEHTLVVTLEHTISDWSSLKILLREVFTAYRQASSDRAVDLPPVALQFTDYAVRQQSTMNSWAEQHERYWNEHLSGCGRMRFPVDESAPSIAPKGWETSRVRIGKNLQARLQEWCRERRTTLVLCIFTVYVSLVLRWCDAEESVFQYQSDGRV